MISSKRCSMVLDAACGTGKYWPLLLAGGMTVIGIDQSQGILDRALAKYSDVKVEKLGLQEMKYQETFDVAICVDSMEFVFPEDWPLLLRNLHRAIKKHGPLYFTVELEDARNIKNAFIAGRKMGLPVIIGEWAHESSYHYYPQIDQVKEWIRQAGFHMLEGEVGDDYYHYLVRKE